MSLALAQAESNRRTRAATNCDIFSGPSTKLRDVADAYWRHRRFPLDSERMKLMKKIMILAGTALTVASAATFAQTAAPRFDRNADVTRQQVIERADQRFARLDVNNDGRATAEEARQAHQQRRAERAGRMFERFDLNSDGSITRAEFDQAHATRAEHRGAHGAEAGEHGRRGMRHGRHGMRGMHGDHSAAMFGEQGFVTREQMREQALARFDRLDANRDGTLTAEERRQARQQRMQDRHSQAD
jgi:Ca2+-binding EF-hand superfamily protein